MIQGRQDERAAIAALIDDACSSRGGALVVRGMPGVGKSVLLDDAVTRGGGMQVLRAQGIESESPLAFAALHRLLRPLMHHVERLPAPQIQALRAAFGEVSSAGVDRFLIFLATLSLMAEAAEDTPVLAVIDDAHWLDDVSAAALLFVSRRLDVERVAILFGARDGDERSFDSGDLPELHLSGIDENATADMVEQRSGVSVAAEVVGQLVSNTGGNPLALLELADALTPEQLAGTSKLPNPLPLTAGVERSFLNRYHRLPEQAQTWLLVAAADDAGELKTVSRAAGMLGAGDDALDAVERSGLLQVRADRLQLRHPLVRSAVYSDATGYRRRQAHRALADVLTGESNLDRRVWHLAAATEDQDPDVATDLDQLAQRFRLRGGHEAASDAWERAAELTPEPGQKAKVLYEAAQSAWLTGQVGRAQTLSDDAHGSAIDPALRADIALLRARIEWNTGSLQQGHHMVLEGAREVASADSIRARQMGMFAAALASFGGDSGSDIDPAALAAKPGAKEPARQHCFWNLLVGLNHLARGDVENGASILSAAFNDGAPLENADQDLLPNLGIAALQVGDDPAVLRYHELLLSRARENGALVTVLYALTRRGATEIATGNWARARAGSSEALQLAKATGQPGLSGFPLALLALLDALQADKTTPNSLAAAEYVASRYPMGSSAGLVRDLLLWTKALHSGQAAAAYHHLARIQLPIMRHHAAIDRFESAVRAGHKDEAALWIRELERYAIATGSPWATAAALHGQALLSEGAIAEKLYVEALELHNASDRVFDRARTQLALGQLLRRARRRVDARSFLESAMVTFADLGARHWEDIASNELRASGKSARKRDPSTAVTLTPQELQVASLIQQGMSNREAAAQMFLSPRTIDFHLRNVFSKLGISTRSELMRHRLDGSAPAAANI